MVTMTMYLEEISQKYSCMQCFRWKYSDRIEEKYGMGTGICAVDGEAKGCDRRACLLFILAERKEDMNGNQVQ